MSDQLSEDERAALIFDALRRDLASAEAEDLALLADILGRPSAWEQPRAALEDLVVQAVLGAESTALAPVTELHPSVARQVPRPRRRRRGRALLSVAAAVAVIAIAGGVLVERKHDQTDFEVELTASPIAPDARGSADMYKTDAGWRVEIDAHGLPHLTGGEYYQAWMRNAAGTEVPIGTFSANGGDLILWSGVSPKQFPLFSVTIERTDNDQSSSGRAVLVGEMHSATEE